MKCVQASAALVAALLTTLGLAAQTVAQACLRRLIFPWGSRGHVVHLELLLWQPLEAAPGVGSRVRTRAGTSQSLRNPASSVLTVCTSSAVLPCPA
jgi:hypothetical protein